MTHAARPLPALRPHSPATLWGWRLRLARVAWAASAVFAITVFLAFIPLNWGGAHGYWLVQDSYAAVAGFLSFRAFVSYVVALHYLVAAVSFAVAGLIVWRKSDDAVALMVALGLLLLPIALVPVDGNGRLYAFYDPPWQALLQTVRSWLATVAVHYMVFLFFIFPDGRFAPRWMKWVAWGVLALFGLLLGVASSGLRWETWFTLFLVWFVLAVSSQIYRYLRLSGPAERQQTKWFVAAVAFGPLYLLVGLEGFAPGLSQARANLLGLHLQYAWLLFLPLGVGIGVLRRGLWGADPIINRTLVFGGLTLLVVSLYGLIVFGLGAAFGSSGNVLLAVAATGLIAIAFNPLRQRLQRAVNRLMYGDRDDPVTVLSRLGQRLETAVAPEATLITIVETVAQTLKAPYAAITLLTPDGQPTTVAHPPRAAAHPPPAVVGFPLTYQSEALGQLLVAPRAPDEPFTAADHRLLGDLARQAAPAVHAYRLTADLQRSRERLVTAREEERRRLRRDLHDGLGPSLASQTFKLDAALDELERDPARARVLLGEVKVQTQAMVADIRRLVYALRPPALDELGLAGALQEAVFRFNALPAAPQFTFEAPAEGLPPLPAAVEAAAYWIAVEALTNAVRHAQARHGQVRLRLADGQLTVAIEDDGRGRGHVYPGGEGRPGVGLTAMRERAEELGGTLAVSTPPTGGTHVTACLPVTVQR